MAIDWLALGGNVYFMGIDCPVIAELKEDNTSMTKRASVATLTAGDYYHDSTNDHLYICPTDSDNPNTNGKLYVGYTWLGFSDKGYLKLADGTDFPIEFAIQGEASYAYHSCLKLDGPISMSISDFWKSHVQKDFGGVTLVDAAWCYDNYENYIWHNGTFILKICTDDTYGNCTQIFHGIIRDPELSDSGLSLKLEDRSTVDLGYIPKIRYSTDDYIDLDTSIEGDIIQVWVGEKTNVEVHEIDTLNYTFLLSQTDFTVRGSTVHFDFNEVTAVYKDDVLQTVTTDYTVDLTNGQISMVADPGTSTITVDGKGLEIDYDLSLETWNNAYSENLADWWYFCLAIFNEIPNSEIDLTALNTLKTSVTGKIGDVLIEETHTLDYFLYLQQTGFAHYYVNADGEHTLAQFRRSDAPTKYIHNEEISSYKQPEISDSIHSTVVVKFNQDKKAGTWEYRDKTTNNTRYKYQVLQSKTYETIYTDEENARDAAHIASQFLKEPERRAIFQSGNFNRFEDIPTDKIYHTYNVKDSKGVQIDVADQVGYILKSISKHIADGYSNVIMLKDIATVSGQTLVWQSGDSWVTQAGNNVVTE